MTSYTSYGRHFTLPPLLEELNRYLMPFLHNHDTVVDFSCGYNVWVPMLKRMCLENGWVGAQLVAFAAPSSLSLGSLSMGFGRPTHIERCMGVL